MLRDIGDPGDWVIVLIVVVLDEVLKISQVLNYRLAYAIKKRETSIC